MITSYDISQMIDHSLLRPDMTIEEIRDECKIAKEYNVKSVCVKPSEIEIAKKELEGSNVLLTTVVGFPHGSVCAKAKLFETKDSIEKGCSEIDMVLNIGRLVSKDFEYVFKEIKEITDYSSSKNVKVKVIFENAYLTDELKIEACKICDKAGVDFVKTSSGYAKTGATIHDLKLMRENTSEKIQIKAAGGIRTLDNALAIYAIGVTRFGATATKIIVEDARLREKEGKLILPNKEDVKEFVSAAY